MSFFLIVNHGSDRTKKRGFMILMNLLFFAQSFAFQSDIVRTPYIVSFTTQQVLVETAQGGTSKFEVCVVPSDEPQKIGQAFSGEINNGDLKCEAITASITFASELEHQAFKNSVAADLHKRLSRGWWRSFLEGSYVTYVTSQTQTFMLLVMVGRAVGVPYIPNLLASLFLSTFTYMDVDQSLTTKLTKYDQFLEKLRVNGDSVPTLYADDPKFLNTYVKSVKKVAKAYSTNSVSLAPTR